MQSPWLMFPDTEIPQEQRGQGMLMPAAPTSQMVVPEQLPRVAAKRVQSQVSRMPTQAPPEMERPKSLIDMVQESYERRAQEAQMLKAAAAKREGGGFADINFKPLLALADSFNGTNTAASYENPAMQQERLRQQLLGQSIKLDEGASDDLLALAKMEGDGQYKDRRMDNLELLTAITAQNKDRQNDIAEGRIAKEKTPTGDAFKAAGFARRLEQTQEVMDNLMKNGYSGATREDQARSFLPKEFQNDNYKSYDQAERNFINATLRNESGASISEGEFKNARQQYIPQPGDGAELLAQKAVNRRQVLENFKGQGANAYNQIQYVSPTNSSTANKTRKQTTSVKVQAPDGSIREVPAHLLQQALKAGGKQIQ